jgi:voltage-gated potassium channel
MRSKDSDYAGLFERLRSAITIAVAGYVFGVLAFYLLGCYAGMNARYGRRVGDFEDDLWSVRHCLYAVGVTFTTIGYQDELGTDEVRIYRHPTTGAYYAYNSHDLLVPAPGAAAAKISELEVAADFSTLSVLATVTIAFTGMAAFIYAIGALTAFFVEGGHVELRAQMRLQQRVSRLRDHVIVCGAGPLGLHAVARLLDEGVPLVVVDPVEAQVTRLRERFPRVLYLRGDPTDIEVLHEAGLAAARGVVAALSVDNDNMVIVVTARQENPAVRILSRAENREAAGRLRRAGAHEVVATAFIGGMRMASEAVRPTVVRFLDLALGHEEEHRGFRIAGIPIPVGSGLAGRSLAESGFSEGTGLAVLALRNPGETSFVYNPAPEAVLQEGAVLGVVAADEALEKARAFLAPRPLGGPRA